MSNLRCHIGQSLADELWQHEAECGECKTVRACVWSYDSDDTEGDSWFTACGHRFVFTCDGPKEHGMAFCCYCGKRLTNWANVKRT